ncbi:MAG TPA: ATP-binding protein [Albitalea sp.]|nr:ATP-binding protein [Albitalea sp.]
MTAAALTAAVVHDVKNRLVLLGEELAKLAALPLGSEAQAHVAAANEQAMQLTGKLVEWLTVQKATADGGLRAATHEEIPELFLEDLIAQARPLVPAHIELASDIAFDVPPLWFFDRQLVQLALDSALHNALRFARSRIVMGVRCEGPMLCFFVHDDGPGVQSQPAPTSTGLGTKLCEQVARAHRNRGLSGHCRLGDHDRQGALFELFLP